LIVSFNRSKVDSENKVVQGNKEEPQPAQGPTPPKFDIKKWKEFQEFQEFCKTSGIKRSR